MRWMIHPCGSCDVDPVNWHVVAQDRTTWKATMLIDVPTNPARHHKNLECT